MAALEIRKDRTPIVLRCLAKSENNARISRRMLAIANALSGMDRKTAAEAAGMDRQALRDWVIRYNEYGIEGLRDRWGKGRPARLDEHEQSELAAIILRGPDPETDGLSAYTLEDLVHIAKERFGKSFHPASMSRVVRRLGFSRQKTRASHPMKDPAAAAAFKKSPIVAENNSAYAWS
jgi:transposase